MRRTLTLLVLVALTTVNAAHAAVQPHAGMLRYADVSAEHIVFLYSNNLWLVPRTGGTATPLASPPGQEVFPRFSPDGQSVAFMGNYDGNSDLYTVPVEGGLPFRVTHHPGFEVLTGWADDSRLMYYAYGTKEYPRATELFTVPVAGGLPDKLPVPYGANGAVSGDGQWLAYTPHSRDHRTWKRYRGGMATDVWLFHLTEHTSKQITDWEGSDSQPMWQGDKVYYMSDGGPEHRLNIWVYDTATGERRQVTSHADYDIKWPSNGPGPNGQGEIVYQLGSELYLLDLATEESRAVEVKIPGARPKLRARAVDTAELINNAGISPSGKRVTLEARGEVWTAPAKKGSPRNLTRTSGAAERDPSWSPDGKWIAYFSDASGEYELYVAQSDGMGETKKLADDAGDGFLFDPTWSPNSKWIAYWDKTGTLHVQNVAGTVKRTVDKNPLGFPNRASWSSDSNWIVYQRNDSAVKRSALWIYDLGKDAKQQVTATMFASTWPTFDREGEFLYFASNREFTSPMYEDIGTTWIYAETARLYAVPLQQDGKSPLLPESDEEEIDGDEEEADDEDKDDKGKKKKGKKDDDGEDEEEAKDEEPEPVTIDLADFEARAIQLPAEPGNFVDLAVNDSGQLVYTRVVPGVGNNGGENTIQLLDLEDEDEEYEKTVVSGVDRFSMSADGQKLLVRNEKQLAIVDAAPDQKLENMVPTAGMTATIDPRQEWRQLFNEAWRVERDYFYDPNMHGVDWPAMRERYAAMLEDASSREDVGFIIAEMISELNVGHTYYRGGDFEDEPQVSVGLLGVDFTLDNGAYKIAKIHQGGPWDVDARGPLSQPGVDVKEGDYLLAVNGAPLDTAKDPWAAFQGMAGSTVTLTVSDKPTMDDAARHQVVELLDSERALRYRGWVEAKRRYVEEKTGGKVGYIYVPNTGIDGQSELVRQYYGQLDREALIIDERWNGGGQIPTRFIELLNRPIANYWARRDGADWPWPPDAHQGPKCMLINALAGSGGDYLPFWFREAGLGKLVGTRTWGGLVGISGNPQLIDGGRITVPTFGFYEKDGTWGIEGHGVEPDIEVIDDPALMVDGADPQLDAAIDLMLEEIETNPYRPPAKPTYPDRSGMGITAEDL